LNESVIEQVFGLAAISGRKLKRLREHPFVVMNELVFVSLGFSIV